jgi:cysteine desulfurase
MQNIINLDNASSTNLNKESKKAVKEFLEQPQLNTDSSYQPAVEKRRMLAATKDQLAKLIGAKSPNIFITEGSSDANSRLLNLIKSADTTLEVISSEIEHSTLLREIEKIKNSTIIKLDPKSHQLRLKDLEDAITEKTILITIQYINNETGQVLPLKEISKIIKKVREQRLANGNNLPIFFHTDASQAVITQDLQIKRIGVDALSLNGSKFGALPSSGILYLSGDILRWLDQNNVKLDQKKENPLSIISLYPALKNAIQKKPTESKRLLNLSKTFHTEFIKQFPEAKLNLTNSKIGINHSGHILNYTLPNVSGEKLVILAGMNGILISTGAACSASKNIPSHVLKALGLSLEQINSSIRISFGSTNKSEDEIKQAAQLLAKLCQNKSVKINN